MLKYLSLYFYILKINLKKQIIDAENFFMNLLDSLIWWLLILFFYDSIFQLSIDIQGWSKESILILITSCEIIKSIIFTLFIENLTSIPSLIIKGELDNHITKPISNRFLLSTIHVSFGNLANIIPSIILLIYNIDFDLIRFYDIVIYIVLMIIAIFLIYNIWFAITCLSFWIKKSSSIHEIFLELFSFTKYPVSIYSKYFKFIFCFIVPILLTVNVPVSILIKSYKLKDVFIFLIMSIIWYFISNFLWKIGLSKYESASK